MAGHIDRQWVNKEILNFNRGMRPYERHDEQRINTLADNIALHLGLKPHDTEKRQAVLRHLQMSMDDDNRQVKTDAADIISGALDLNFSLKPRTAAQGVVDSLINEEGAPTGTFPKITVAELDVIIGDDDGELMDAIAEIEDDKPLLVRLEKIVSAVDSPLQPQAIALVSALQREGITHIYTG
jgi:hypothetical protein